MTRDPRYDILFEPVRIGPATARNRLCQVSHCNGMGRKHPTAMAVMRGVKAEGGWGAVCSEQCDIHVTSNTEREIRLWDDRDIPYLARVAEQVHKHDGLAGLELPHMGYHAGNCTGREVPMAPSGKPGYGIAPFHARTMDKTDIADYRRWHRNAALRGKDAICAGTKGGLDSLTMGIAKEVANDGIRVCGLRPGFIKTEVWEDQLGDEEVAKLGQRGVPLGRVGEVAEVARATLWLCSDDAAYMTGTTINVSGGREIYVRV